MDIVGHRYLAVKVILALLTGAVLLAGCDGSEPATPATPATPSATPTPAPRDVPNDIKSLDDVCEGKTYRDSPAYDGPGPHQVHLTGTDWAANLNDWATSSNADEYKLVGCLTLVPGPHQQDCTYTDSDAGLITQRLVRADIQVRLIEVRTGRQVTQTTIAGKPDQTCQISLMFGRDGGIQYGLIDEDAFSRAIDPYARRTV